MAYPKPEGLRAVLVGSVGGDHGNVYLVYLMCRPLLYGSSETINKLQDVYSATAGHFIREAIDPISL